MHVMHLEAPQGRIHPNMWRDLTCGVDYKYFTFEVSFFFTRNTVAFLAFLMKQPKVSEVYVDPLPYSLGPLPNIVLHNPLSIVHFLWVYFTRTHPVQTRVVAHLNAATVGSFVEGPMMARLWSMGFFGKGTLSRSEPSWFGRTARRLGLDGGELSFEELTELRRQKRRQFKKKRSIQEQLELKARLEREGKSLDVEEATEQDDDQIPVLPEELALIIDAPTKLEGKTIIQLERLELMPCESVFLSLGLGILDIYNQNQQMDVQEIVQLMCGSRKLMLEYVVYHYLRSLGWCVRSGVKFGTDFIVYKQGPPFQHAQFAVMILHSGHDEHRDWWWSQAISRVVGAVRKTLVFCYVDGPDPADIDFASIKTVNAFRGLLKQYTVQSVVYSRWAPTKTRD